MTTAPSRVSVKNTNVLIILSSILLVITVSTRLFMELYAFPLLDNFMEIYIPAKSGGRSYFVDPDEFALVGNIAIIVAAVFTALIVYLAKTGKIGALLITMLANFTAALMYFAVMFGNIADAFWDGWWSVAGVIVALIIVFGLEVVAYKNIVKTGRTIPPRK